MADTSRFSGRIGAQRLPASRRAGPACLRLGWQPEEVLNAFRHHGERDRCLLVRQRDCVVLNAFRHHGERDSECRRTRPASSRIVLNAFRHHGERDCTICCCCGWAYWCSTPSGITASGTDVRRSAGVRERVLNAFRHHGERDDHSAWLARNATGAQRLPASRRAGLPLLPVLLRGNAECSTPSGITASGTSSSLSGASPSSGCAQRLPASRRAGPCPLPEVPRHPRVLNAFRHHGERDSGRRRIRSSAASSAQRLPASRRAGPCRALGKLRSSSRCSTPSGITASGTAPPSRWST